MAVITINQKIDAVNNFINAVDDNKNSYYFFVGKPDPWLNANGDIDDTAVPAADDSVVQIEQQIYQNMVYAKKVNSSDLNFMTSRYNWVEGTTYSRYDNQDTNLYSKNFFVITDTNDVYKCIHNGFSPLNPNGVPSTIKPSVKKTTGNFQTTDGYIWKYMFTCEPAAYLKFQTSNYIPVTPNNDVTYNAVPGTIDNLVLFNGGSNFQVYEENFLQRFVNNSIVQLPDTSSPVDNYYTGSSIYLKTGYGAGQIRPVVSYSGLEKNLSVSPAFNYYENLKLENINGGVDFTIGRLVTQRIGNIIYFYRTGYFNQLDTVIQSDTGAFGTVRHANSTTLVLNNDSTVDFNLNYPIYNPSDAAVKKNGKIDVDITANAYQIVANSSTNFLTDYANNQYIRIGENANNNIRRITGITSSIISVNYPFTSNVFGANNYLVPAAATVDSVTNHLSEGSIVYTNLNSAQISYSNSIPLSKNFIVGESIVVVDEANTSQNSNGTLSFSNSSSLILSNVLGTIQANLYVVGTTSQVKAHIDSIDTYPNITVETIYGGFLPGAKIDVKTSSGSPVGNAMLVSKYSSPGELTEYIISPSVNITGDGNGALAYSTVDLSSNNPSRSITSLVLINGGQNYTKANVTITSNTLYGSNAVVMPQLSPVNGHGSDAYSELGSIYCGISKKFDTAQNDYYTLPIYGSYRNVGIIKNPLVKDVIFDLENFDRTDLTLDNTSDTFETNEIVIQPSTNAAGIIVFSNSSFIQIKNTKGTFIANTTDDNIYGLTSTATANCIDAVVKYFTLSSNVAAISEIIPGGTGNINQILSNTEIRLTDALGAFAVGDSVYEPSTNAYATISAIYTSNGTVNSSYTFGERINQTSRITLTSNTKPYSKFEYVTQEESFATGRVISTADELDLVYNDTTNFTLGEVLLNTTTGANAIITYVNNSINYIKLSAVSTDGFNETTNRPFNPLDTIQNVGGSKITTINNVYSVLLINDVNYISGPNTTPFNGVFTVNQTKNIIGDISGASGYASLENSIVLPEFVRESGKVIYFENLEPFTKTPDSTEQVKIIIKF